MTDYITEELLLEILDTKLDAHRDLDLEKRINHQARGKIYPGHTNVLYSDHMKHHGHAVVRLMNRHREIEYHIHNYHLKPGQDKEKEDIDTKSMLHSFNIIKNDAELQLQHGRKIKIQAPSSDKHATYGRLAHKLVKGTDKVVKDIGHTERSDGSGELGLTHTIESRKLLKSFSQLEWNEEKSAYVFRLVEDPDAIDIVAVLEEIKKNRKGNT